MIIIMTHPSLPLFFLLYSKLAPAGAGEDSSSSNSNNNNNNNNNNKVESVFLRKVIRPSTV